MKYWFSMLLIGTALVFGGLGAVSRQVGLDIVAVIMLLAAVGVLLWSYLHLSLSLRHGNYYVRPACPRSDEEQADLLQSVIFRPVDRLSLD
jgi:hypothetical protein